MSHKNIEQNLLPFDATIKEVLSRLNQGVFGVVFIGKEDNPQCVQGLFTDGDVRRAILNGATMDSPARNCMNEKFTYGKASESHETNILLLKENIRHLPILDDNGCLVDFISWAEMWRLPVMEPSLGGNELNYLSSCITTNWISSQGKYVTAFEENFAEFLGSPLALTTSNGTTALQLALTALGVGQGDEVIVPDLTFGASANAVIHTGARPVFVDVSPRNWTMDPDLLEAAITPQTKAIMPVHLYGHPCEMDSIMRIARERNLFVVEDCAEALGAEYKGTKVGTFGDAGCFSFFSNKVITTGEGGMVVTGSTEIFDKMKILRDHGMSPDRRYWHEVAGFNFRMTNMQAAVGLAQLEQIDSFLDKRQKIATCYLCNLSGLHGVSIPPEETWAKNIFWLISILVDEKEIGLSRDELMQTLSRKGIETRPFFCPLHLQPPFKGPHGDFPVTDRLAAQGISLPSSVTLTEPEIERVCSAIKEAIEFKETVRCWSAGQN